MDSTESPIDHEKLQSSSTQLKFQDKVIHDILEIESLKKSQARSSGSSYCVRQSTSEDDFELFATEAKDLGNSIDNMMPDYLNTTRENQLHILQEKIETRKNLLVQFQQTPLELIEEKEPTVQEFEDDIEFVKKNSLEEHQSFVDVYLNVSTKKTQQRSTESELKN